MADGRYERKDDAEGKFTLIIRKCCLEDTGTYSFEIQQFVKEGELDQIDCRVNIERESLLLAVLVGYSYPERAYVYTYIAPWKAQLMHPL